MTKKHVRDMDEAQYRAGLRDIEAGRTPGEPAPVRGKLKDARIMTDDEWTAAKRHLDGTGTLPRENNNHEESK
jgi:hypothetical protein